MSLSKYPSIVSLPRNNPGVTHVLDYLIGRFPGVSPEVWRQRMIDGKVHWHDGSLIAVDSPCRPQQRVYYYRETAHEPVGPD